MNIAQFKHFSQYFHNEKDRKNRKMEEKKSFKIPSPLARAVDEQLK